MENLIKILIIAYIIFVGALGLTAGMLFNVNTEVTIINPNSTTTAAANQHEWHYITTYNSSDAKHDKKYSITTNNKIKLLINGKPKSNHKHSNLLVAVYYADTKDIQNLDWTAKESADNKSAILYPNLDNHYELRVDSHNMVSWKVEIYEYY